MMVKKIISGGQTGVDRAALDVALEKNIPCGGWCPKGRRAEDGPLDIRYPLIETESRNYGERTAINVGAADATLIFSIGPPTGGTGLTIRVAKDKKKKHLMVDLGQCQDPAEKIIDWLNREQIDILNVAGPSESKNPGIYDQVLDVLHRVFEE